MQNKVKRAEKAKKEEEEKKVASGKENKKLEKKNKKTKVSCALINVNLQADLVDESKWPSCELWKGQSHKRCVKCTGKKSL